MLPAWLAEVRPPPPRRLFFDCGASLYTSGSGGASQAWFVDGYARRGLPFDRILAWEFEYRNDAQILRPLPAALRASTTIYRDPSTAERRCCSSRNASSERLSYFNFGVDGALGSGRNPLHLVRRLARPDDFVVSAHARTRLPAAACGVMAAHVRTRWSPLPHADAQHLFYTYSKTHMNSHAHALVHGATNMVSPPIITARAGVQARHRLAANRACARGAGPPRPAHGRPHRRVLLGARRRRLTDAKLWVGARPAPAGGARGGAAIARRLVCLLWPPAKDGHSRTLVGVRSDLEPYLSRAERRLRTVVPLLSVVTYGCM
mmetsp:Transcript_48004/g.155709  ORF Transcript_48004/g.155709 Transcript_48004/m.155709 type:complete len:319 (+) Transcript_48004:2245-3201(+)